MICKLYLNKAVKVKGWKKINSNNRRAGAAMLISEKIDFKTKIVNRKQKLTESKEDNRQFNSKSWGLEFPSFNN